MYVCVYAWYLHVASRRLYSDCVCVFVCLWVRYACQIGFSPNGQFLMSGDGFGQLHFWDWKSCKSYRKLQAHDGGPCMGAQWHPIHPSMVATCGYDGLVKIWD